MNRSRGTPVLAAILFAALVSMPSPALAEEPPERTSRPESEPERHRVEVPPGRQRRPPAPAAARPDRPSLTPAGERGRVSLKLRGTVEEITTQVDSARGETSYVARVRTKEGVLRVPLGLVSKFAGRGPDVKVGEEIVVTGVKRGDGIRPRAVTRPGRGQ
jgi:hypothetical protein